MPNTLAHMGVQALITRRLIARADLGWVWLGCLLPDLPWILQRVLNALSLPISPIDIRLYAAVQSTLLLSLVAGAAFALLSRWPVRVFAILALGCLLHLLLDAMQTKWANGVLLAAPLDWRLLNFGLYWPEDWPSYALAFLGLGCFAVAAWQIGPGAFRPARPPARQAIAAAALFILYGIGPVALMSAAEAEDVHYAGTLRDAARRPGHEVEFDRAHIRRGADGLPTLAIWTGETLRLTGLPIPRSAGSVSVRGRFADASTVEVAEVHLHPPGRRDLITVVGLGLILIWWGWSLARGARKRARTP